MNDRKQIHSLSLDAKRFSLLFSYEEDAACAVGKMHDACIKYQFALAMRHGDGFIEQSKDATEGGRYGDLGTSMNQYDLLKVSNVAQYIVMMDAVILKLCSAINCMLIRLVHTPKVRHVENKLMECACCIAHHHKTISVNVMTFGNLTYPNKERMKEAQVLGVRIVRITLQSLERSLTNFADVL